MKQETIAQLQKKADSSVCVARLCRLLEISRSGYYAAKKVRQCQSVVRPEELQLQADFMSTGRCYGSRRLMVSLQNKGFNLGRYRVRSLMKKHHLRPIWRRKFTHTTDSNHGLPCAPNLLDRQFNPNAMNQAWVSDITYIRTQSGWLYLAAVMDLYSRKIVGWASASSMPAELVCRALELAIAQRQPKPGLIIHSDRGSQYASDAHRQLIKKHGFEISMSRRANCWDNAVMERFFLNLKMERVWQKNYANHAEAQKDITDYIVRFYNAKRLHSTLGNRSPITFEQDMTAKQPILVSENT